MTDPGYRLGMDLKADIREFLSSRRARLTPEVVGLRSFDDRRRVPGLRREEVAALANVSLDYYVRMERGNLAGVSQGVLEATAEALRLTEPERPTCSTSPEPPTRRLSRRTVARA